MHVLFLICADIQKRKIYRELEQHYIGGKPPTFVYIVLITTDAGPTVHHHIVSKCMISTWEFCSLELHHQQTCFPLG